MTKNEEKLFKIINENDNPQEALLIATEVICDFLKKLQSSQEQYPAFQQELL
jgi:hypothetical protein